MLAVLVRRRNRTRIRIAHARIFIVTGNSHVGGHVIGAEQRHIDALGRENFVRALDAFCGLELHDHPRRVIQRRVLLLRRHAAVLKVRQRGAIRVPQLPQ